MFVSLYQENNRLGRWFYQDRVERPEGLFSCFIVIDKSCLQWPGMAI